MIDRDKLRAIDKTIHTTENLLKEYRVQRADILRAEDGVEDLARYLWAHKHEPDEDDDPEFYERLRTDEAYRDEEWETLTIASEKNEWRDHAVKVIEVARRLRPGAEKEADKTRANLVALLARHVDPEEGALTITDSDRSAITRYLREYIDILMQR